MEHSATKAWIFVFILMSFMCWPGWFVVLGLVGWLVGWFVCMCM